MVLSYKPVELIAGCESPKSCVLIVNEVYEKTGVLSNF